MKDSPRTGDGYKENEQVQKDVLLDQRLKEFQRDFAAENPPAKGIREIFRKGKS